MRIALRLDTVSVSSCIPCRLAELLFSLALCVGRGQLSAHSPSLIAPRGPLSFNPLLLDNGRRCPTFNADGYAWRHQQHTRLRAMKGAASEKTALHVCGYQLVVVCIMDSPAWQVCLTTVVLSLWPPFLWCWDLSCCSSESREDHKWFPSISMCCLMLLGVGQDFVSS